MANLATIVNNILADSGIDDVNVAVITGSNQFNGSQAITGSLTVTGQVVAQTLNVQQVTSSIVFSSGSNIFGNSLSNTQQFTGSVSVTGSLTVNGTGRFITTSTNPALSIALPGNSNATILEANSGNSGFGWKIQQEEVSTGDFRIFRRESSVDYQVLNLARSTGAATFSSSVTATNGVFSRNFTGANELEITNTSTTNNDSSLLRIKSGNTNFIIQAFNQNQATSGTAVANSVRFYNDGAGGLSLVGDNASAPIVFYSGGAANERMRITSGGNVLIGTTTSTGVGSTRLQVSGTSTTAQILLTNTNPGHLALYTTGNDSFVTRGTGGIMAFGIAPQDGSTFTEHMRLTSGGNVGIGTCSPNGQLDSYTACSTLCNELLIRTEGGFAGCVYPALTFGTGGQGSTIRQAQIRAIGDNSYSTSLTFWTQVPGTSNPMCERMRITSTGITCFSNTVCAPAAIFTGCVGIGMTTSPGYKLDITNSVAAASSLDPITLRLYNGSDGGSAIYFQNAVSGQSKISFGVESTGAGTDNTYLGFSTGVDTALTERMRITSGGLIGINTTSPFNFGSGSGMIDVRSQSVDAVSGVFVSNCNATARLTMYINNAAAATIGTSTNHALQFATQDIVRMSITTTGIACFACQVCAPAAIFTGCVGIGTTTPQSTLHLCTVNTTAAIRIESACEQAGVRLIAGVPGTARASRIDFLNGATCVGRPQWTIINDYNQNGTNDLSFVNCDPTTRVLTVLQNGNATFAGSISVGPFATIGNQGGTDTTVIGGGSGIGSSVRMNFAGGTMQNLFQGNGDNFINCVTGKLNAAGGVKFGAGSGTLNYYEQGTWTPRLSNGSFTTNTNTGNAGWYVRIGNSVTVGGTLSWTGGTGAQDGNSLQIGCLPFAANNAFDQRSAGSFGASSPASIGFKNQCAQMTLVIDPGASFIYLIQNYQDGTYLSYRHDPCANTSGILYGFSLTYQV
jgi:hypothetical protein